MSAASEIRAFARKCELNMQATAEGSKRAALNSIKYGSKLTGAPGQPVQEGDLRESWGMEDESPTVARIFTSSAYAVPNETGVGPNGGPYRLRAPEGGRWSVLKTSRNFDKLVDDVVGKLVKGQRSARKR